MDQIDFHQPWISDTNEAMKLHLTTANGIESFGPTFTYTLFGEKEQVFGYNDLEINLSFTPSLFMLLTIESSEKHANRQDIIMTIIKELALDPSNFTLNTAIFKSKMSEELVPIGEKVHESNGFCFYSADFETSRFKKFLDRLRIFMPLFIEGSTDIESIDPRWQSILVYKKTENDHYDIVGYTTYYPFFHFPDKLRMRISQFLILPPYQRQGVGKCLYNYLYDTFLADERVIDITVEDPNDDFQDMRDRCDVMNLLSLKVLKGVKPSAITKDTIRAIQKKHKLSERQATRCVEILMLKYTLKWDPVAKKEYRLYVKQRLYNKNREVLDSMDVGDRFQKLQETYELVEEDYVEIVDYISR